MADPISFGLTVALTGAQMALTMSRKIEGPRLKDLKVTVADFGTPLNYFYGIRRFEGIPIIWAEDIIEIKKKKKTKGGKYNDYTYYCSWAVVVANHEIDAVTRIWFDKHLVYDATGAGPITPFDFGDFNSAARARLQNSSAAPLDHIRIYLGTETQEADPRMLATIEALHGAGSCPAYRGSAIIVFEDVPLEKVGNRIPQISVEAVSNGTAAYPYETVETNVDPVEAIFSPDFAYFLTKDGADFEFWDTLSRRPMLSGSFAVGAGYAVSSSGTIYGLRSTGGPDDAVLVAFDPDGGGGSDIYDFAANGFIDVMTRDSLVDGTEVVFLKPYSNYHHYAYYLPSVGLTQYIATPAEQIVSIFADLDGNVWGVGGQNSGSTLTFTRIYGSFGDLPGSFSVASMPSSLGSIAAVEAFHYRDATIDHFVVAWDDYNHLVAIDLATQAISISQNITALTGPHFRYVPAGAASFWIDQTEYSSATLTVIRSYSDSDLLTLWDNDGGTPIRTFYDPINHALVSTPFPDTKWTWRFLDRVGSDGVTLGSIVSDVATRCGIDGGDLNVIDLDQIVQGFSWTQGPGKSICEPLMDAYDSILRPHNFGLEGLKRGDASGGTVDVAQFVRQGGERYTVNRALATDLPRRLTFSFADVDADQQTNSVVVQRPLDAIDGVREVSLDMTTWASDADEARGLGERWFRRQWFGRVTVQNALSAQYIAYEPGDVRTLSLDGESFVGMMKKWTYGADGVIGLEWERDDTAVAVLSGSEGAPFDGRVPSVIAVPLVSKGFVLDIPLVTDSHNNVNPLLYYGAGPYGPGSWPGAVLYQSLDAGEEYSDEVGSVPSTAGLTWGYTTDALADAIPWVWDRGNSVNVALSNGTLTSTTEAACDGNPMLNLCLIGDELLQFTTATLEGDGSYTLTGLKRGRRGSEWACATHAVRDQFIMLDNIDKFEMGASDLGDDLLFKAVTSGRSASGAFPIAVDDYVGESHKPYAPADVGAVKDSATGDWTIDWHRRSRIGGRWVGGATVPLGESAENYKVKLYDPTGVTLLHTYTPTSEIQVISAADQTTYAGGAIAVGDLEVRVLQVGDLVDGRETVGSF